MSLRYDSSSGAIPGVAYYVVKGTTVELTQSTYGNIVWLYNTPHLWNDKYYYYPIATRDIVLNPNLTQNPGW